MTKASEQRDEDEEGPTVFRRQRNIEFMLSVWGCSEASRVGFPLINTRIEVIFSGNFVINVQSVLSSQNMM